MNGQSFTGGDCFLQKSAPIQIKYYTLKITVGSAASEIEGQNYSEVVSELKTMGFTNITLKRSNDLVLGWLSKEGNIKSISINGVSDFSDSVAFAYDDTRAIAFYQREQFVIRSESIDNSTNEKEFIMTWSK